MNKDTKQLLSRIFRVLGVLTALSVIYLSILGIIESEHYNISITSLLVIVMILFLALHLYFGEKKGAKAVSVFLFFVAAMNSVLYALTYLAQR